MGLILNPGNELFQKALNSEIYIDKSGLIEETNKVIKTSTKYICVSRPRRFGKSMVAHMLTAYYRRGCSSKEMFSDLKISKCESFKKHLNKYNVIYLNMDDFLYEAENADEMIKFIEEDIEEEILDEFKNIKIPKRKTLAKLLDTAYKYDNIPFIFIIDEWDCIFRIYKNREQEQVKYLNFLKSFLKDKEYVALAYMTGILPIKKYGQHSALNMFTEVSMTNPRQFGEFTGFTENEVKNLCKRYNMSYEDTKKWYNGYDLKGISIYNPRAIVMSMTGHDFSNYWTSTETYEALTRYIEMDFEGLKNAVTKCLAGEKIKVDITSFSNDMITFATKDDILTLLIHLGYLTYDFETESTWIPNGEITQQYATIIKDLKWPEISKALLFSDDLLEATLKCDEDDVKEIINKIHSDNASMLQYNDAVDFDQMQDLENPCCPNGSPKIKDFDHSGENSLACVISIAYYSARRYYNIYRELPTGKGYADLVFIPRKNVNMPAMIIELKYNKSAETAIKQIKNRRYTDSLKDYHGEVILAGINYNKDDINKNHECRIEKIKI